MNFVGDGSVYFCPSFNAKPQPDLQLSASYYSPMLTEDNDAASAYGQVRSAYVWNPWAEGDIRIYKKITDFKPGVKVLLHEYFIKTTDDSSEPPPEAWAHNLSGTIIVAYSDMSVKPVRVTPQMIKDAYSHNHKDLTYSADRYKYFLLDIEEQH